MKDEFDIITDWILNDCDDTHGEIHWLLELLYSNKKPQGRLSLKDAYADVFRHLERQKESKNKKIIKENNYA